MPGVPGGPWLDDDAGRLVRPYTVSDGRTRPSSDFDLMTMVAATGVRAELGLEHEQVLRLCAQPVTVAEIAAYVAMPAMVVKVLLSDLLEAGAITTRRFTGTSRTPDASNAELLEAVLDGLRRQL